MHNAFDRNVTRLAQSSIGKAHLMLCMPIILSNGLHATNQLVNAFWVGRLGASAVSVVSVSSAVVYLLVSLGCGPAVSGSILVAQYAGARDHAAIEHVSAQTLLMVAAMSLVLAAIGYIFIDPILGLMGIGADIFEDSIHYVTVSLLGIVFMLTSAVFQSTLRGIGEVKIPLYVTVLGVILNLILDPLLIFGWGPIPPWGVVGAAYATLVSQGLAAMVGLKILFGSRIGVQLRRRHIVPDRTLIKRIFLLGLPSSIEQSMSALGMTVFIGLVAYFGTNAIAACGIGFRVLALAIIPAVGISMATATLVGQSIGAGNLARAKETAVVSAWYTFWLLTGAAVLIFAGATPLVRMFLIDDPVVIRDAALVVRFLAVCFGMIGIQMSLIGAILGAGNTFAPMVLGIVSAWAIDIPLAYCLSRYTSLGELGLWYSFPISAGATTILTILLFKRLQWERTGPSTCAVAWP